MLLRTLAIGLFLADLAAASVCKPKASSSSSSTSPSSSSAPSSSPSCGYNLVSDPNFADQSAGTSFAWITVGSFAAISVCPSPASSCVYLNLNYQHSGSFSQNVPTTAVGQTYSLSFDYEIIDAGISINCVIPSLNDAGNAESLSFTLTPPESDSWKTYSTTFRAASDSTSLTCTGSASDFDNDWGYITNVVIELPCVQLEK
ncbi:hypothetical protein SEUCBS139899_009071 [Sporothrix eucalyptigena]|uniref:Uncharacterized protein n=1 Tax=Sporothrix eucalyptigena TaxID=1812306 RepID=A0ABP0CHM3_9PEZI